VSDSGGDHKRRATLSPQADRPRRTPRLAAGRARALGLPTLGTTNANRLRRVDRWLLATQVPRLRDAARPLVVDLGYGSSAVTTLELVERLAPEVAGLEVVGLEIDPARVAAVKDHRAPPRIDFRVGGFELAGLRPVLVRAFNVLRQYDEESAARAWETMRAALAPGGLLVEGTCDEWGRRSTWVALDAEGPLTLTLSARVADLSTRRTWRSDCPRR
jgi:SAM-dependent methyltransferase